MPPPLKLTLINSLERLPEYIEAIGAHLQGVGVNQHDTYCTELIIEELITNTIKYGYGDSSDDEINIELEITPSTIQLKITDKAKPFDPTSAPQPSLSPHTPVERCKPGGLGLLLVKKLAKKFRYKREGSTNKQTLSLNRT